MYFSLSQLFIWMGSDQVFIDAVNDVKLLLAFTTLFMDLFMWTRLTMLSISQKMQVFVVNMAIGVFLKVAISWYLIINMRLGIVGVFISYLVDHILRSVVLFLVLEIYGFNSYREIKM